LAHIFLVAISKINNFNFVKFMAKKRYENLFFHPSLLLLFLDPGSEIRDPGWVKISIRDKHLGSATLINSSDGLSTRGGVGASALQFVLIDLVC
jgi:hypothetical protein